MESIDLKLVYRVLRKISEWTLTGYYSEVHVEGQENVPKDGPLIIASSHHNEIIDIATLAVTIPYRRPVGFWAKSTLFANPIARAILLSSGSIPVQRNPNNGNSSRSADGDPASVQAALFRGTSLALAKGDVVGVFPEGTSCTEPSIALLRDGAAYSAVEYAKWENEQRKEATDKEARVNGLVIVPVGIVYTQKKQFKSRICIRYGKPIRIDEYTKNIFSAYGDEGASRAIVKDITANVERQLLGLTVNAPDWETVYSVQMARDILWGDEKNVALKDFVQVSQTLSNLFTVSPSDSPSKTQSQARARASLIKYYSLLHYTDISHSSLTSSLASPSPSLPSVFSSFTPFLVQLAKTTLHPRGLLFLPMFAIHIPAYILGPLAGRVFPKPREEEAVAQHKVIFGGLGMGLSYAVIVWHIMRGLVRLGNGEVPASVTNWLRHSDILHFLRYTGQLLAGREGGPVANVKRVLTAFGVAYAIVWVFAIWHNALVGSNYRQIKRLIASFKVLVGLLTPRSQDIPDRQLRVYERPLPPWWNPMVKRRFPGDASAISGSLPSAAWVKPPFVASWRLIRHMLAARLEATRALRAYFAEIMEQDHDDDKMALQFLRDKGAHVSF